MAACCGNSTKSQCSYFLLKGKVSFRPALRVCRIEISFNLQLNLQDAYSYFGKQLRWGKYFFQLCN